jgi:hypothetical protein
MCIAFQVCLSVLIQGRAGAAGNQNLYSIAGVDASKGDAQAAK